MSALSSASLRVFSLAVGLAVGAVAACAQDSNTQAAPAAPSEAPKTPKIPDQLPKSDEPAATAPATTPAPASPPAGTDSQPPTAEPDATQEPPADETPTEQDGAGDDASLGEIPEIKAVELSAQTAQSAIDTYLLLKDKYKEARLEDYETLQEFVDKDAQGKAFEADVKAAGFADVEAWNQAITTVSTTYANLLNDQSGEIRKQIEEVEKDTELAQDMKDRLINSMKALIPSENNKKVIAALQTDPAYADKLKQLETEEE